MHMLKVTANSRYLQTDDGRPFFYLGDTAWELLHRLTLTEAKEYFRVRAEQRFNVIQMVVLAEFDGLTEPNRNGDLALIDVNPLHPNKAYFVHVDAVIQEANKQGLTVGLLPAWGDKVNKAWGAGPEIFNPENAAVYGEWLGNRYRNVKNLLWINGGDRKMDTPAQKETFRALAHGLRKGDEGNHLITFHPQGGRSSSEDFQEDDWLAFNLIQSGHHARDIDNTTMIERDYHLQPIKPTLDDEFNYENHPVNWKNDTGRFRDYEVRLSAYRSVFAGGCGICYGCQDVWQFFDSARHPAIAYADTPWHEAVQFSGAWQMQHLRKLMESVPFTTGSPAQQRIVGDPARSRVTAGTGYLFAYLPIGGKMQLNLDGVRLGNASVSWFDPRTGITIPAGAATAGSSHIFTAPSSGLYNDWVLTLRSA